MSREIRGLIWAKACNRPSCIPKSRPKGKKAAGLRYERELAKVLKGGVHGQWFEFEDSNGHGWCQPDLFFEREGKIWVLEAKYTWTEAAYRQIEGLYVPVLSAALRKQVRGIQVCKVLRPESTRDLICRSLGEAIEGSAQSKRVCLHWLGVGLEPFQVKSRSSHLASSAPVM